MGIEVSVMSSGRAFGDSLIVLVLRGPNGSAKCSAPYRLVGESVSILLRHPEPLRTMLYRRQRRGFEQKAAKETKGIGGLGFRDDYSVGAFSVSSNRLRPRSLNSAAKCSAPYRMLASRCQYAAPLEPLRTMLYRR